MTPKTVINIKNPSIAISSLTGCPPVGSDEQAKENSASLCPQD
jgi:hypothetical protein